MARYAALLAVLACCAALSAQQPAAAQEYCGGPANGTYTCTIPSGNQTTAVSITSVNGHDTYSVESDATFNVTNGSYALQLLSPAAVNDGGSSLFQVTITGAVALDSDTAGAAAFRYLASGASGDDGQSGGWTNPIQLAVGTTSITATGPGVAAIQLTQTGGNGGAGADDATAPAGGTVSTQAKASLMLDGAAISSAGGDAIDLAFSGGVGGQAGKGDNPSHLFGAAISHGGAGGAVSSETDVAIAGSTITAAGRGLAITQTGGAGGSGPDFSNPAQNQWADAGDGAYGGDVDLQFNSDPNGSATAIRTTGGDNAAAVLISSTGGTGGGTFSAGNSDDTDTDAGDGGSGGAGGTLTIGSSGALTINTQGNDSPGIGATSQGAAGGSAGRVDCDAECNPGAGGRGGAATSVNIALGAGAAIATQGNQAPAIMARAFGGTGGAAGGMNDASGNPSGGTSGAGGEAWPMSIALSGDQLSTRGTQSPGILAQAIGGQGGSSNGVDGGDVDAGLGDALGTAGGAGGNVDGVSISTDSANRITTGGDASPGIIAQLLSGPGGAGGIGDGFLSSTGGAGGVSGTLGDATVTNAGLIATGGSGAQGIIVQSIAGGGGVGGSSWSFFDNHGGNANLAAADGGYVAITDGGTITTHGPVAAAILGQSVGGGGGAGGSGSGVFYNQGGSAGVGGNGGAVAVNLDSGAVLQTAGELSHGVLAQSVGGSGGSGGNAQSNGTLITMTVGGSGGAGGNGGAVTVGADGAQVAAGGTGAVGVLAQSVGGGGGAGGAAYSLDVGNTLAISSAVGGAGGDGGDGGGVAVTAANTTISTGHIAIGNSEVAALPVDAIGVLAQSIGGGGGVGGGASANAVAVGMQGPGETRESMAITTTMAVGGVGGSGGNASPTGATANLQDGTRVTTAGAGSIGVLAQAIGGGGGQGGDSSTFSATIGSANKYVTASDGTTTISVNVAAGATGGSGGDGGPVGVNLGSGAGGTAGVATTGDYADGILAQSIGGGGGNAGVGSSDMYTTGAGSATKVSIDDGARGGVGGSAQAVTINLLTASSVATLGSGAVGVLAQSIGGGGGNSTGSTVNLAGLTKSGGSEGVVSHVSIGFNPTIGLGSTGGSGGAGGEVTTTSAGSITTIADDAPGMLLQSIGGGGGVGGSPGQDAAPNGDRTESPIAPVAATAAPGAAEDDGSPLNPGSVTFAENAVLSLGGTGGAGAGGGAVAVTEQGAIQTSGDYSPGMIAQSIGGGGGRGGTALVGNADNTVQSILAELTVNTNTSLGFNGQGGGGGAGGAVTVDLGGAAIATGVAGQGSAGTGFQSMGVFAQSIGGGGGMAADGTLSANGLAAIGARSPGSGSDGGAVVIRQADANGLSDAGSTISTAGDYAIGIMAQSVGGGGGVFGAGAAATSSMLYTGDDCTAPGSGAAHAGMVCLDLGAQGGGNVGNGGTVSISGNSSTQPGDASDPILKITTTGNGAFGVLAQSIGAGGGLATVGGNATVQQFGATGGAAGDAADVSLDLDYRGSITTSGAEAHGVVAQSIGGGGGVVLFTSPTAIPAYSIANPPVQDDAVGRGGNVSVKISDPVTVNGAGSFGVLAQSIGGGGGLAALDDGTLFLGTTNPGNADSGAGDVSVETQQAIAAKGENGVGIFAQSAAAPDSAAGTVTVTIDAGTVQGGSGAQGYGVWVDGGNAYNTLSIDPGATLTALSGSAVYSTGAFGLTVNNNGTVEGDQVALGGGTFTNGGSLVLAGPTGTTRFYGTATLHGNLVQTASGEIHTDVDFAAGRAGRLVVTGNATLGGRIVPNTTSVLPNVDVPVLTVDGAVTGAIAGGRSALFAYAMHRDQPQTISLSAQATGFAPAGFPIRGAAAELAEYLLPVFNTAATPDLGTLFGTLGNLADSSPSGYADALDQLAPGAVLAFASRTRRETLEFSDALVQGCRDHRGARTVATATGCAWMEVSAGHANQGGADGYAGFSDNTFHFRGGAERDLAPGWRLGGALGYGHSSIDGDDGTVGGGDAGYAGLSLARLWRGWRLAGAIVGTFSSNTSRRVVSIPGFESALDGAPDVDSEAALLRADYTFEFGRAYIRPALTAAVVRVHADSFSSHGQSTIGLDYGSSADTSGVFEPDVRFGFRNALEDGMALDSYVTLGASLPTNDSFEQPVRFLGAAPDAGTYDASIPTDHDAALVGVGVQLVTAPNLDFRLEYHGAFAHHLTENTGMLLGTVHF